MKASSARADLRRDWWLPGIGVAGQGDAEITALGKSASWLAGQICAAEMVIEIGAARVRVLRGFDATLLGEVVRALGGTAR